MVGDNRGSVLAIAEGKLSPELIPQVGELLALAIARGDINPEALACYPWPAVAVFAGEPGYGGGRPGRRPGPNTGQPPKLTAAQVRSLRADGESIAELVAGFGGVSGDGVPAERPPDERHREGRGGAAGVRAPLSGRRAPGTAECSGRRRAAPSTARCVGARARRSPPPAIRADLVTLTVCHSSAARRERSDHSVVGSPDSSPINSLHLRGRSFQFRAPSAGLERTAPASR